MTLAIAMILFSHSIGIWALIGVAVLGLAVGPQIPLGALSQQAVNTLRGGPFVAIPASGAINPHVSNRYLITKAGVAALTLAAPTAGADDGVAINIVSNTANAHTVTATGLYQDGGGHVNLATFAANIGASFIIVAIGGKWFVEQTQNVTMS